MAKGPEAGRSSWTAWAGPGHRDPGGSGAVDEVELGAAALKAEEGAASQGMWAPLATARQGGGCSPEPLGGAAPRHPDCGTSGLQDARE